MVRDLLMTDAHREAAMDMVRLVIGWYSARLAEEENADTPDAARVRQLVVRQEACAHDLTRLRTARDTDVRQILETYSQRYRNLTGR